MVKLQRNTVFSHKVYESYQFLKNWHKNTPEICIVLGSGLSNTVPNIENMKSVSYSDIPGFKPTHISGHEGDLRVGEIELKTSHNVTKKRSIAFLRGRNHAYEGHNAAEVVHNVRSMISWGVKGIILTNAAGCLNTNWELGKLMLLTDHINGTGMSPINGEFGLDFGPRFVDLSNAYCSEWQEKFIQTAKDENQTLYSGVYYGVPGSQYETPAEIRMMQKLGAQAVGMSTVLETIAIRQMGAKVAGLSCFTNYGAGLKHKSLSHSDVMEMGSRFAQDMASIVLKTALELEV